MQQTPHAGTYFNISKMDRPILKDASFTGRVSGINKNMVGLGNVDNTSDASKPISTATQTALNLKADKTYVNEEISNLVGGAPDTLNTLKELSNAINDNNKFSEYVNTKAPLASPSFTGSITAPNATIGNIAAVNTQITGNLLLGDIDILIALNSINEIINTPIVVPPGATGATGATGAQGPTGPSNYTTPIPSSQMVVGSISSSIFTLSLYSYHSINIDVIAGIFNYPVYLPSQPNIGDWLYVSSSNAGNFVDNQQLSLAITDSITYDVVKILTTPNVGISLVYFGESSGWVQF